MGSGIVENDIISLFIWRKGQNICRYAEIFTKYTLKRNVKLTKIINKIIEIYMTEYYFHPETNYELLSKYFEIKESTPSMIKDVLTSSLLFYQNSGLDSQINDDINTIVILSNLIYLALKVDEYTNEFNNDLPLEDRLQAFFNDFAKRIKVTASELEPLNKELLIRVRKDVTAEKKFFKALDNNSFILQFHRYVKNDNYYMVSYYYDIKQLSRYDTLELEKARFTKGINDDLCTIYLEKLTFWILKEYLKGKRNNYYFFPLKSDYLMKNKNLLSLDRILNNRDFRKKIILTFDYDDIRHNMSSLKMLAAKGYKVATNNISSKLKLASNSFDLFDYVFMTRELYDTFPSYHKVWEVKNAKFILDDELGINVIENR